MQAVTWIRVLKSITFVNTDFRLLHLNLCRIQRHLSTMEKITPREIQIPMPHGYIAAQEWGPADGIPVLAVHGWMDNSGSFDTLIPLLTPELHVIAIDEPGLGLSTPMPPGAIMHHWDLIYHIRRALGYLKWDQVTLLGHSRGGAASLLYAALFPKQVSRVILLDIVRPIVVPSEYLLTAGSSRIDSYLKYETLYKEVGNMHTPEAALSVLLSSHSGSITEESAKILMKRGTKPAPEVGKVVFSRDLRLKAEAVLPLFTLNELRKHMAGVTCELLIITAEHGLYSMRKNEIGEFLEIYSKNCKRFEHKEVSGSHHVHLNEPEKVAPIINSFLKPALNGKL